MAAIKIFVILGLFAVALGFTIPEQQNNLVNQDHYDEAIPAENVVLVRNARSPQGRVGGSLGQDRDGTSGSLYYNHQLNKNYDITGEFARHFGRNDNSAMLSLNYRI